MNFNYSIPNQTTTPDISTLSKIFPFLGALGALVIVFVVIGLITQRFSG